MSRRAAPKVNAEARSAKVPINRSDDHRDERCTAPPELVWVVDLAVVDPPAAGAGAVTLVPFRAVRRPS